MDNDTDEIINIMESELSISSTKQDGSARATFGSFLRNVLTSETTFESLEQTYITKNLIGR